MDQPTPTPTSGMPPASASGKNFLKSTIGQHPGTAAVILAVLVVLVLILGFMLTHWKAKSKCPAAGKFASGRSRLVSGPTPTPAPSSPCGPGETAVQYTDPDSGTVLTYCQPSGGLPGPAAVCGKGWDPAATAEAQALATVGSLQHDNYGERKLQGAINAAYDSSVGLSDAQLTNLMNGGDAM